MPCRGQGETGRARRCRSVSGSLASIMSAILARWTTLLTNAQTRKRPVQHRSGAPGLDRTADTRFRKPVLYPLSYEGKMPICR